MNEYPIDSVIEVRLEAETWRRVTMVAAARGCTYSWVVRYALFRLIRRDDPGKYIAYAGNPRFDDNFENKLNFRELNRLAWEKRGDSGVAHRHRLCLYGEDELFIRMVAARLGCTISHLIRLALERHLDSMLRQPVIPRVARAGFARRSLWLRLGIKVQSGVVFHTRLPKEIQLSFEQYKNYAYY